MMVVMMMMEMTAVVMVMAVRLMAGCLASLLSCAVTTQGVCEPGKVVGRDYSRSPRLVRD